MCKVRVCIQRCKWLFPPYNAGKNKNTTKKTFSTLGNVWKMTNRNNMGEGVKHVRYKCRRHLPSMGFPRWVKGIAPAGDTNTKHHFTSFRWLIGFFRPRSSGSDVRTGCELLITYMFRLHINSDLPPSFCEYVIKLVSESCNSQTKNTAVWSKSNYVSPARKKKEKEKLCFGK